MLKIRLMRVGKRKQPSYRVVVADSRSPRDGRFIETLGHYQPRGEPSAISIDSDRALYWLQRGAQPSDPVKKLLRLTGAWSAFTGEPQGAEARPAAVATDARSLRATPAASVVGEEGQATVAEMPEAHDQEAAAPDWEEGQPESAGEE